MNYPILVGPDDIIPSLLMPNASDMGAIRIELESLKRNMFDSVGLMLQNESRQVASAAAKAWDFADIAQVMSSRAVVLQDAENRVAQIIHEWDTTIPLWTAVYNRNFDVGDFKAESEALSVWLNIPQPAEMHRELLRKGFDRVDRVGAHTTPERRKVVEDAIDAYDPNTITVDTGQPQF